MIIKISNLNDGVHNFDFEGNINTIELNEPFYNGFSSSVRLEKHHYQIIIDVSSEFKVKYECDRCGKAYKTKLKSNYQMVYFMNERPAETDSINISYLPKDTVKIDISSDVREYALLSIPMKKLCKENCKGLCPNCGKDLNKEQCSCKNDEVDSRWKPLIDLKDKLNLN